MSYNNFVFVSKRFGSQKRGAHTKGARLSESLGIEHLDLSDFTEELYNDNRIKILLSQINYRHPLYNNSSIRLFTKKKLPGVKDCFSDGFSHAISNNLTYMPTVTTFKVERHPKETTVGFYLRPNIFPDSYLYFLLLLKHTSYKFHVYTMGYPVETLTKYKSVLSHTHTTSNTTFFENITHLYYPRTNHTDTFPNTLLEAFQNNVQVISPTLLNRTRVDGIDDILSFASYHTIFNLEKELDNSSFPLTYELFESFYKEVLENDYRYPFDPSIPSLEKWLNKYL